MFQEITPRIIIKRNPVDNNLDRPMEKGIRWGI